MSRNPPKTPCINNFFKKNFRKKNLSISLLNIAAIHYPNKDRENQKAIFTYNKQTNKKCDFETVATECSPTSALLGWFSG